MKRQCMRQNLYFPNPSEWTPSYLHSAPGLSALSLEKSFLKREKTGLNASMFHRNHIVCIRWKNKKNYHHLQVLMSRLRHPLFLFFRAAECLSVCEKQQLCARACLCVRGSGYGWGHVFKRDQAFSCTKL